MPQKKQRQNIYPLSVDNDESEASSFGKYFYFFVFTLLASYSILSIFLEPDKSETEVIKSVSTRHFSSRSTSSLDVTIYTDMGNKYFISTSGRQPFEKNDTILTFSNKLFKKVGIQTKQNYYEFGRLVVLLVFIGIISVGGGLYTLFSETVFPTAVYIIGAIDGIFLIIYLIN